jgi:hypothetical protein
MSAIVIYNANQVVVSGNEIESSGGPAIVVIGLSNTISIINNYMATNSVGMTTYEGQGAGALAARTYGPLRLKPFCDLDPLGQSGTKCSGSPKNITVTADILINGCLLSADCLKIPSSLSLIECMSYYCNEFPTVGVVLRGNYHGTGTRASFKVNQTDEVDVAYAAVVGIAMIGADISDNSCVGGGCQDPPPLLVTGTNAELFATKHVRMFANTGFQNGVGYKFGVTKPTPGHTIDNPWPGAGALSLLANGEPEDSAASSCMHYHTVTSDRVRVRNLLARPLQPVCERCCCPQPLVKGGTTPTITMAAVQFDGDTVHEWYHASGSTATAVLLGVVDLATNPSVVNHSVYLAIQTRVQTNSSVVELLIDPGDGRWRSSGTNIAGTSPWGAQTCTAPPGRWGISSFQLALHAQGTARFGVRLSSPAEAAAAMGLVLETRGIAAAVIGADWERLFAQTTVTAEPPPPPPPPTLAEELAQLGRLRQDSVLSEAEFVEAKRQVLSGRAQ